MCGISLIVSKDNNKEVLNKIHDVNNLIKHRGPDGDGSHFFRNISIGHRRLSIIDLSDKGAQPMNYGDNLVLSYNGEIYNYIEIRKELIMKGYKFYSQTDSEVILAAYKEWGEGCVKKFNGMWSFVLLDKERDIIFCSRDRFGVKPFYFYNDNKVFVAGSEIKQILPFLESNQLNESVFEIFLLTQSNGTSEETFFSKIIKLNPSENLIYDLKSNTYSRKRYFDIEKIDFSGMSDEEIQNGYNEILTDAIRLRLRSDVKVGSCLSGGMDSSTIAAKASELYSSNDKFSAFHGQAIEKQWDESNYAKDVSNNSDLDLHIVAPTSEQFVDVIEDVITLQEEPFPGTSIFMGYFVFKTAREQNCTVLLDGQGGDETLLGYEKYISPYLYHELTHHGPLKFIDSMRKCYKNNTNLKSGNFGYFTLLKYFAGLYMPKAREIYSRYRSSFYKKQTKTNSTAKMMNDISRTSSDLFKLQRHEIYKTVLPTLLNWEDKNSMRFSIETRLPFVDYRHITYALSMPARFKINNGWTKYALRKYSENMLPKHVIWRKNKFGFAAPEKTWFESNKEEFLSEIKQSKILKEYSDIKKIEKDFNHLNLRSAWSLANIAIWERIYKVN
tara:strand:+ start:10555 stop:12393 length:1839 start_codon:yes stop_codon:yes gene_type:complete